MSGSETAGMRAYDVHHIMPTPEIPVRDANAPSANIAGIASELPLSPELAALFPAGAVAVELRGTVPRNVLTSVELNAISHCAEKRVDDFTRGRACAHRGMRELGISDFSLLSGDKREPLWPAQITGSITHTTGFAAAVVARRADIAALGIDCEVIESVDEELWERICTPVEQERLARLPVTERRRQAALIFAAKEAFYKCQFSLSREWVGFEDVNIEPQSWPAASGSLRIVPQVTLPVTHAWVASLVGRFQFRDKWVVAGVTALI